MLGNFHPRKIGTKFHDLNFDLLELSENILDKAMTLVFSYRKFQFHVCSDRVEIFFDSKCLITSIFDKFKLLRSSITIVTGV
jgi:hypothetical protein